MKLCPNCNYQLTRQNIFQTSVMICYRCYSIGFTQSSFSTLLNSQNFQGLVKNNIPKISLSSYPCFLCSSPSQALTVQASTEKRDNLRVFQTWKYWFDYHRKGPLLISRCQKCQACWMNVRTFCQFRIDWDELEVRHREVQNTEEASGIRLSFDNPYRFVMGLVLGIPQLENTPAISELPMVTYIISVVVGYFTSQGFKHPEFLKSFTFNPIEFSKGEWTTVFSYAVVHENRAQFFGAIIFFLVFAPMVEHELAIENYLLLLVGTAAGAGLMQAALLPHSLTGLAGVVSGILTFFCLRFPSSVIGFGIVRFSAPVALCLFLFFDLQSVVGSMQGNGDPAHVANLGGALSAYIFHLIFPAGKATAAFKKLGELRIRRERDTKNWRK